MLVTEESELSFSHPRVEIDAIHGTGCTLSSAIATHLGQGDTLADAVEKSCSFIERAVRYHLDVGTGSKTVHHLVALREKATRATTIQDVEGAVDTLVDADVSTLVPEVGMQIVGATPYAEVPKETAAIDGRITRTSVGPRPNRDVRLGASSHIARFLLASREQVPRIRYAANCRFDTDIEAALEQLNCEVLEFSRAREPTADDENSTMQWGAGQVVEQATGTPIAVIDRGDIGKEPMTRLLTASSNSLTNQLLSIADTVDT